MMTKTDDSFGTMIFNTNGDGDFFEVHKLFNESTNTCHYLISLFRNYSREMRNEKRTDFISTKGE